MFDDVYGALLMAKADVRADERAASTFCESRDRRLIHVDNREIAVDDRDARSEFLGPINGNILWFRHERSIMEKSPSRKSCGAAGQRLPFDKISGCGFAGGGRVRGVSA